MSDSAGRTLRADARENRKRIFDIAKQLFAHDPSSASMDAIAKKAGVGVGSLYRAFGNRSGLALAIYCDEVDRSIEEANRLARSSDPSVALRRWLANYIMRIITKRTMLGDLQPLFDKDPEMLSRSRASILNALRVVLVPSQQCGAVRDDIDAADLIALTNGAMTPGTSEKQALKRLEVILDGLSAPVARAPVKPKTMRVRAKRL